MLDKLTRKQLAVALGLKPSYVYEYVTKGRIIMDDNGLIDIKLSPNQVFIDKSKAKGYTFDINRLYEKKERKQYKIRDTKIIENAIKSGGDIEKAIEIIDKKEQKEIVKKEKPVSDIQSLAEEKLKLEVEKLRLHNEIETLKKLKIEGALIPVDAVQNITMWIIDTYHNTYFQEVSSLANVFKQVYGADHEKYTKIQKELTQTLNKLKGDAKENLLTGIDGIVAEYSEVRGRGERK